jgi:nucleotide-binding universal stress UspA family protein
MERRETVRILLCVAGMPYAEATLSFGGLIARITKSPVTLLHVAPREEEPAVGEEALLRASEMLVSVSHLSVETRLRQGDPIANILAEAQEGDYDLIVIGACREVGLAQRLLGSVAQAIVRRVPISVLVVRQAKQELKRVLICTGGLDVANPVIEAGAQLAGAARAKATLLYVTSPAASMYTGMGIRETLPRLLRTDTPVARHLRRGAKALAQHQVDAKLKLRHGVVADEILQEAREGDYDLIVMGASGATGRLREWLLRNVTRQVVEHALCAVLVVKRRSGHLPQE